jgi:hypothetical protein
MRLTNTYTRLANVPDFGEAQELYEQTAQDYYEFMVKVERLADLLGLTPEEVFQEIQEDFLGGGKIASTRSANIPMRMDAGNLREQLAHELHQWRIEGFRSPDWIKSFWTKVKHLAKLVGKTREEVHQELIEDVEHMEEEQAERDYESRMNAEAADSDRAQFYDSLRQEDEEGLDLERTSAKKKYKAVNPWAVCHSQLGPEKDEKFERCVQDVKKTHKIKKD